MQDYWLNLLQQRQYNHEGFLTPIHYLSISYICFLYDFPNTEQSIEVVNVGTTAILFHEERFRSFSLFSFFFLLWKSYKKRQWTTWTPSTQDPSYSLCRRRSFLSGFNYWSHLSSSFFLFSWFFFSPTARFTIEPYSRGLKKLVTNFYQMFLNSFFFFVFKSTYWIIEAFIG